MIRGYSDHAANERTFLAWVRTGIAVIAFGFVIEKFNLFVLTMANANSLDAGRRLQLARLSGPLGRYDGLALIVLGVALGGVRAELLLSAALALIVAGFSTYLALG
jgi:putative membrane protein